MAPPLVVAAAVRRRSRTFLVAETVVGNGESNYEGSTHRHDGSYKRGGARALRWRRRDTGLARRTGETAHTRARERPDTGVAGTTVGARIAAAIVDEPTSRAGIRRRAATQERIHAVGAGSSVGTRARSTVVEFRFTLCSKEARHASASERCNTVVAGPTIATREGRAVIDD